MDASQIEDFPRVPNIFEDDIINEENHLVREFMAAAGMQWSKFRREKRFYIILLNVIHCAFNTPPEIFRTEIFRIEPWKEKILFMNV